MTCNSKKRVQSFKGGYHERAGFNQLWLLY